MLNVLFSTGESFVKKSTITDDEARVDVSARGFWVRGQRAFLDIRAFSSLAKSHVNKDLQAVYRSQEKEKKRKYNNRILEVDMGTFTPLIFSCMGGMSRETHRFYNRLAELISEKRKVEKSEVSCWIKTKLNFSLIRSLVLCIRGTRSSKYSDDGYSTDDVKYINTIASINSNN